MKFGSLEVWPRHDEVSPKVASRLAEKPVDPCQSVGSNSKKSCELLAEGASSN